MENTKDTIIGTESVERQVKQRNKPRTFSQQVLPSNRHVFAVQMEVLKRFVTHGRSGGIAASNVEGEGVPVQAASMNVRFMRSIGLLNVSGRGLYVPTPEAIQFVNAKSVSDEKAKPILAALLNKTWFAELAQSLFSTSPLMTEDQFIGELALSAQTDRIKEQLALKTILDYLLYAGILIKDERGLTLGIAAKSPVEPTPTPVPPLGQAPSTDVRSMDKPPSETAGWHVLQTEDFYLKVKSDVYAVEDLVAHLETLKKKIERQKGQSGQEKRG